MENSKHSFDKYSFALDPNFNEKETRAKFAEAVPLETLAIFCYDPRASEIPAAVADFFGDTYPGELIRDGNGRKVGSTATLFPIIAAGGRAVDALRSISVAQHLFGIRKIAVVHHSYCGATTFTAEGIVKAAKLEYGKDISDSYAAAHLHISDFEQSLEYDVNLLRESPGVPNHADIYGFFYEIDTNKLTLVHENKA